MDLQLNRVDYNQVGVTSPGTMKLLSSAASAKQSQDKVVIGDHDGILTCFNIKKHTPQVVFKTLPGPKITSVSHGSVLGTNKEKIFVASGSEVRGFTKKGKQFLTFDSNLTESIQKLFVNDSDLFICGNYVYNQYHDCRDVNYFLASDKINDITCLPLLRGKKPVPVLACQDRIIRLLDNSELLYEVEVSGVPMSLCLYGQGADDPHDEVLYGTSEGNIGLLQLSQSSPEHLWEVSNQKRYGGVLSLGAYDITNDGIADVLVGREDGVMEVYGFDEGGEPIQKFKHSFTESLTSICGGHIGTAEHSEVILSTYSGWVIGMTTEPLQMSFGSDKQESTGKDELREKISALNTEIEQLQRQVLEGRHTYQESAQSDTAVSAVPTFSINDRFALNQDDASYTLSLEVQMAIDTVLLQSNVPVDLLDVDKNSAVVSNSSCGPDDGNFLLATYRCQANTTRLELKIRTIEGQYGTLQAYIAPRMHPKTCQMISFVITPLSLHHRSHVFDDERPHNVLNLKGAFSLAEIHSWIRFCLPDVPERTPAEDTVTLYFISSFLETQLECSYSKGAAKFRSDNISTISILKDVLSKEATSRKINLNITYELDENSVTSVLERIDPKLEQQLLLAKKVQLIDGLKDLSMYENDTSFLAPEYQDIIANADKLRDEFKKQPCHLERLYGMITDLYIDKHKFKGQNVKNKVPALMEILDSYDINVLKEFFQ